MKKFKKSNHAWPGFRDLHETTDDFYPMIIKIFCIQTFFDRCLSTNETKERNMNDVQVFFSEFTCRNGRLYVPVHDGQTPLSDFHLTHLQDNDVPEIKISDLVLLIWSFGPLRNTHMVKFTYFTCSLEFWMFISIKNTIHDKNLGNARMILIKYLILTISVPSSLPSCKSGSSISTTSSKTFEKQL